MLLEELGVCDNWPEMSGDAAVGGGEGGARVGVTFGLLGAALRVARGARVARVALVRCGHSGGGGGRAGGPLRTPDGLVGRRGRCRVLLGALGQVAVREAVARAVPVRLLHCQLLWQLAQRTEVGVRVEVLVLQGQTNTPYR